MAKPQPTTFDDAAFSSGNALVRSLQNPVLYDHPIKSFSVIETHISWVLLTGTYAYKIKKPVNFGFVDFSTLEKRQYYCEEELRLNRRFAPDLYLQVVGIVGSPDCPYLQNQGEAFEYAVKMKEFPQSALVSELVKKRCLLASHIDSLAEVISKFHNDTPKLGRDSEQNPIESINKWSRENFDKIESIVTAAVLPEYFNELKYWCLNANIEGTGNIKERLENGFVRECHGDLHLGNIALIKNKITLFDCIEFNPELRWVDTISEIAFVTMDLCAHDYSEFAWRFTNHYLAVTGDYNGITLLRYYIVYRALVRAKVACLGVETDGNFAPDQSSVYEEAFRYIDLAQSWITGLCPAIIVMHGLSGSGKSTIAAQLVEQVGAIQLRSDIERKRLFDLEANEDSASATGQGIYTKQATHETYERLAELAQIIVTAGFTVIIDASFLKLKYRDQFKQLAWQNKIPYIVISCEVHADVLRERIIQRQAVGQDPSEANLDVLEQQLQFEEPLNEEELIDTFTLISTGKTLNQMQLQALKQRINTAASD